MSSKPERGSIESRLAVLRLGLLTVTAVITAILITFSAILYVSVSNAANDVNVEYSLGDYLGVVGPVVIPSILIIVVGALVINFGYTFFLRNQAKND